MCVCVCVCVGVSRVCPLASTINFQQISIKEKKTEKTWQILRTPGRIPVRSCDSRYRTIISLTIIVASQSVFAVNSQRFGTQQEIVDFSLREECYAIHETIVEAFTLENPNVFVLENLDAVHRHAAGFLAGFQHHNLIIVVADDDVAVIAYIREIDSVRLFAVKNRYVVGILRH